MLVTFFGCCGVCTENHCMLYIYGTLLSLILLMEVGRNKILFTVYFLVLNWNFDPNMFYIAKYSLP